MSTLRTPEDSRAYYIARMGEPLGSFFAALWQDVAFLHLKWHQFVDLYGDENKVALLNQVSPLLFRLIQDIWWREIILHIARLTDPPKSAGKENFTLQRLPQLTTDRGLQVRLQHALNALEDKTAFCRDWRNRHVAHKDLRLALEKTSTPLPPVTRKQIEEILAAITEIVNLVAEHFQEPPTIFEFAIKEAEILLFHLEKSVHEAL